MPARPHASAALNRRMPGGFLLFLALWWVPLVHGGVGDKGGEVRIPAALDAELNYLLGFVGPHRNDLRFFNTQRIAGVLGFVAGTKEDGRLYHAGNLNGTSSSYYETDIRRNLGDILRLTYSSDIPSAFTAPSTVRTAHWKTIDTPDRALPRIWERLPGLKKPVFFTGVEHLVNTPDQHSGAYYDYDLDRTVILLPFNGHPLLISLSSQHGISGIGKKGLTVGPDDQWDYLYTGQSGINRPGLGWADTYMYQSYSVAFYLETAPPASAVRIAMFKWLSAGWAGINVVRSSHIYDGLKRFAITFKQILEHDGTADLGALTQTFVAIRQLPLSRLRPLVQIYLNSIEKRIQAEHLLSEREVTTLFRSDGYLRTLDDEDMESIVAIEFLKQLLGKPYAVDMARGVSRPEE